MKKSLKQVTIYGYLLLYLIEQKFPNMNQSQRFQLKKNNRITRFRCNKCDSHLKVEKGKFDNHLYCVKCFSYNGTYTANKDDCCSNPKLIFAKHINSDGRFQLRKICENCVTKSSDSFQFSLCTNLSELSVWNEQKSYSVKVFRYQERDKIIIAIRDLYVQKNGIFTDYKVDLLKHAEYIKSPEWKIKRKLVLERDNYKCLSCLSANATEVHHLSYKHLGNEPLFELVSICRRCHQEIYNMDNDYDSKQIVHEKLLKTLLRA